MGRSNASWSQVAAMLVDLVEKVGADAEVGRDLLEKLAICETRPAEAASPTSWATSGPPTSRPPREIAMAYAQSAFRRQLRPEFGLAHPND